MKQVIILCICAAALASCGTTSKQVAHFDIPEFQPGPAEQVDIPAYEQKYGKGDGVILSYERIMEHCGIKVDEVGTAILGPQGGLLGGLTGGLVGGRWDYIEIVRRKYLILNPDEQSLTTFNMGFKPKALYIHITTPDGIVRQYGLADLQEEKDYDNSKNYKFAYPGIVKGTIIEEGYQIEFSGRYAPMDYDIALQFSMPCEKLKVSYAYPDWWKVAVKDLAKNDSLRYVSTHDTAAKKITLAYEAENIPAYRSEPYAPYFKEVGRYMEFMVTDLIMKGLEMHRPTGWIKYADQVRESALGKSGKNAEQIRSRARDIVKNCPDSRSRIDTVLAYVQTNIRVGDVPKNGDFVKVMTDGVGSILDITGLTYALLKSLNMRADLVLVHSGEDGYFDPDFVSLEQFQMPAVTVKVNDSVYTLLPYIKNLPSNHTTESIQGQTAMPISEESAGIFEKIPPGNLADNIVEDSCDITMNADGKVQVRERRVLRGLRAFLLREVMRLAPEPDVNEAITAQLSFPAGSVHLDTFAITDQQAYNRPLVLDLQYTLDNLAIVTPDEIVIKTADLLIPIAGDPSTLDPADRRNPIKISYDEQYVKHVVIHFPSDWSVATALDEVNIENLFGRASSRYSIGTGLLDVDLVLGLNKSFAPKEDINALAALIGRSSNLAVPAITFRRPNISQ